MVSIMCTGAIAPSLPYMAKHYSYLVNSKFLMRFVITAPHLVVCIFSIPISFLLAKKDKIAIMSWSFFAYAIFGTLCFWVEKIYYIIALRALLGVCISVVLSTSSTLIADLLDGQERKRTIGLQTTIMSIGTITYNLLSGYITDKVGWRYNFLLYAIPSIFLPLSVIYLYPIRKIIKNNKLQESKEALLKLKKKSTNVKTKKTYRIWLLFFILLLVFVNMMMYYMIPLQLPFFLASFPSMIASKISVALSMETLFSAIGGSVYSRISKKINRFSIMGIFALILMISCYKLLSVSSTYIAVLALMPLYGFAMGMMMPNVTIWIISETPKRHIGIVMSAFYSAIYLGKFSCSIWLHFLSNKLNVTNPRSTYMVGAWIMAAMVLALIIYEIARSSKKTKEVLQ